MTMAWNRDQMAQRAAQELNDGGRNSTTATT